MERQRTMLQTKEQDKTSEKELNEKKMNNLPDRVQTNGHKCSPNSGEKWMNSENFNEETENIKKTSQSEKDKHHMTPLMCGI